MEKRKTLFPSDYLGPSHEGLSTAPISHELVSFSRGSKEGGEVTMEKRKTLFPSDYLGPSHGGPSTTPISHELVSLARTFNKGEW